MRLLKKGFLFFVIFSVMFFVLRTNDDFNREVLLADIRDLGGVPWLYSVVGIIFSVLAAFTIQNEWQQWSNLVAAVRGEVEGLKQLWHCASHLPEETRVGLCHAIRRYLSLITKKGLDTVSSAADHAPSTMRSLRFAMQSMAWLDDLRLKSTLHSILASIIAHRSNRLLYSLPSTPGILKNTVGFAGALLIALSLFIGVRSIWLDYLFTMSIALLAFVVYLVVDDLDNPLRPGIWQLTPHDYHELLRRLEPADSLAVAGEMAKTQ